MAERRMFAKTIIDSDAFLDMPLSTQALYFHLSMRADDDGFINNPQKITRMIGGSKNDMDLLLMKSFIIPFENGICVIKHWRIHNYIRPDRYKPTVYQEELNSLELKDNRSYSISSEIPLIENDGIPNGNQMDTQDRLGKDRLGKDSIDTTKKKNTKKKYGEFNHVRLTDEEYTKLINEYGSSLATEYITYLDEYIEMKGYKAKSHYMCIKKWVFDAVNKKKGGNINGPKYQQYQSNTTKNYGNVKTGFSGLTDEDRAKLEAEGLL